MTLEVPSRSDPLVRGASTVIGGPLGTHARPDPAAGRRSLRVLLALTLLTLLLGWLGDLPCRDSLWSAGEQYTKLCYTDVTALYFAEGLDAGKTPYQDHPVEYPVLIGGLMLVAAGGAELFPASARPEAFFDLTALMLAGFALLTVATTARLAGRRRWDAAMVALAPTLALHANTNWDLAAVGLAGLGLLAWARRRPVAAGVLLGLAIATKLYPVLFLGPLFLLCLRAGRLRPWLLTAGSAAAVCVAVNLPIALAYPQSWRRFFTLNTERGADWDSLWFLLQSLRGRPLDSGAEPTMLNAASLACLLVLLAGVTWLALAAPRRPRLASLLFLTVVAFLLTNKVWSPQYSLWLVPLAVLARPSWRLFLGWQVLELAVWATRLYYFLENGQAGTGLPLSWFLTAVVLRDLVLVAYAVLVVRDVLRPDSDPVRASPGSVAAVDDPAGGVLDRAPDAGVRIARPVRSTTT